MGGPENWADEPLAHLSWAMLKSLVMVNMLSGCVISSM
jgi:hypothetical protein